MIIPGSDLLGAAWNFNDSSGILFEKEMGAIIR
jgi:hypothetical protein